MVGSWLQHAAVQSENCQDIAPHSKNNRLVAETHYDRLPNEQNCIRTWPELRMCYGEGSGAEVWWEGGPEVRLRGQKHNTYPES